MCCRDPNYVDPWPQGMMMKNMNGGGQQPQNNGGQAQQQPQQQPQQQQAQQLNINPRFKQPTRTNSGGYGK